MGGQGVTATRHDHVDRCEVSNRPVAGSGVVNVLTVDVEEYYHGMEFEAALSPAERLQASELRERRELPPVHPDGTPVPFLGTVRRAEIPPLSEDPQVRAALEVARAARNEEPPR